MEHTHKKNSLTEHVLISKNTRVIISPKAFFRILYHGYQFANPTIDKNQWVEVMGWVSGYMKTNRGDQLLIIDDSWPITHGDAISVSIGDYGNVLTSILAEIEKIKGDHSILGWYHSHPGYGLFMSQVDYETQQSYQKLFDKAIALVLDQTLVSSIHTGIEVYRLLPDFITFENIPLSIRNGESFDQKTIPSILQLFQDNVTNGKHLIEFDQ